MADLVRADILARYLNIGPWRFRQMLPSGVHCEGCHRLVRVEEAWAGVDGWDFGSVFDLELLIPLLLAHAELDCSAHDRMLEQYRTDPYRYNRLRPID